MAKGDGMNPNTEIPAGRLLTWCAVGWITVATVCRCLHVCEIW